MNWIAIVLLRLHGLGKVRLANTKNVRLGNCSAAPSHSDHPRAPSTRYLGPQLAIGVHITKILLSIDLFRGFLYSMNPPAPNPASSDQ